MGMARHFRITPLWAALLLNAPGVLAAPGDRDTTFGSGGSSSPLPAGFRYGLPYRFVTALEPGGNLLVGGLRLTGMNPSNPLHYYSSGAVLRLDPGGRPDPALGGDGLNDGVPDLRPQGLFALANGRMLMAGNIGTYNSEDYLAARFLDDGMMDSSFGDSGTSSRGGLTSPAGDPLIDLVRNAALAPDGSLVMVGYYMPPGAPLQATLMRLRPDGSRDDRFGSNGIVAIPHMDALLPHAIAIQGDGRLVVAGQVYRYDVGATCGFVARLEADGSLDAGFGTNGITFICLEGYTLLTRVAVQPDGKLVASGMQGRIGALTQEILALRLDSRGQEDTSFGANGIRRDLFGTLLAGPASHLRELVGLALQPDGRIVVGSVSTTAGAPPLMMTRLLPDGRTDVSFGIQGLVQETEPYRLNDLLVQPDGKLVVSASGWTYNGQTASSNIRVYRYIANDAGNDGRADPWDLTPGPLLLQAQRLPAGSMTTTGTAIVTGLGSGLRVPVDVYEAELSLDGGLTWSTQRRYIANGDRLTLRFLAGTNPLLIAGGMHAINNSATVLGDRVVASLQYADGGAGANLPLQPKHLIPQPGATRVPRQLPRLQAVFPTRLDPATITASALTLSCNGTAVTARPVLSPSGRQLSLLLTTPLPVGAHCQATLSSSLRDIQGNTLGMPAPWTFSVHR